MISYDLFEQQWLEDIVSGDPSPTDLGNRFVEKILRDWHEIDSATAEIILCDGAGDGGIDAVVFNKEDIEEGIEGDSWMIVQGKYGSSYSGLETITSEAQKLFATLEGKREKLSCLSTEVVERLRTFLRNRGKKDRLDYIIATTKKLSSEDMEYINNIRTIGRSKFGERFDVETVCVETIYNKVTDTEAFGQAKICINLDTSVASSGDILLIGATSLPDIFKFMQNYKKQSGDLDLLYEKNVRKFLGNKRKVNKGIESTIEQHPERFGLYNNGITIVAEEVEKVGEHEVRLKNPFIVNGCQTTKSIWSVLQRRLNAGGGAPSDAQLRWEEKLGNSVVVTKIVVVGTEGEELLTQTTRYTNSENAVGEKDFIALEKDFRSWAPAFNAKYGAFLEIQRGAWEARRAYQKQNPSSLPRYEESANAFELLKVYAAGWLREPGFAYGKNPPFAPGGSLFNKIVNDPGFGIDSLFSAYLMQKLSSRYGFGRGATLQTRGQTRYLFIMVAVDIVRDFLLNGRMAYGNESISTAIIKLSEHNFLKEIGDAAIQLIDDYLTDGNEDTLFDEPEFQKTRDLNAFLKSEKLGKSDEFSPRLRTQLVLTKKMFRKNTSVEEMKSALAETEQ